jgi:hypothetical protein
LRFDTLLVRGGRQALPDDFRAKNSIVRRMVEVRRILSEEPFGTGMSFKTTAGVALLVAAGFAAGGYYWLRAREDQKLRAVMAAEESPAQHTEPVAQNVPSFPILAPKRKESDSPVLHGVAPETPLREGESLEFSASVSKVSNVASLKLQVAERQMFGGKQVWHLRAFAHTQNALRMIFELDDRFESYSDAITLVSQQYEMHLSERGQKVESVQRMVSSSKEPAPSNATAARVLPGTRDPLGMMQFLRTTDWLKTPEVHSPVYDGHKLYDARAKLAARGQDVKVPAGNYKASRIEIRVFENGVEMKDAAFQLYLAENQERTPVLLEATMPFATAHVELVKVK